MKSEEGRPTCHGQSSGGSENRHGKPDVSFSEGSRREGRGVKRMRVLIAEDEATSRMILSASLEKWGYEVVTATDGKEAWEILQENASPRIAVLDWMMPGMDGVDICRKLKSEEGNNAKYVILLTARDKREDIIEGLEAGADDYVSKPFDKDEFRARIAVGRRIVELQEKLSVKEKLQGALEMAGAVCHEMNQPLQGISGYSELLMSDMREDDPHYRIIQKIKQQTDRLGNITSKLMRITRYERKKYLDDRSHIIDIDKASANGASDEADVVQYKREGM